MLVAAVAAVMQVVNPFCLVGFVDEHVTRCVFGVAVIAAAFVVTSPSCRLSARAVSGPPSIRRAVLAGSRRRLRGGGGAARLVEVGLEALEALGLIELDGGLRFGAGLDGGE